MPGAPITSIAQIINDTRKESYILRAHRPNITLTTTLKGLMTEGHLPEKTSIHCWWDRHPFTTVPLGIPVKMYEKKKTKRNYIPDCFVTDGIFCSFPCMLAYLFENINNPKYKNSLQYIYLLHKIYFKTDIKNIPTANSWKLLKAFGGTQSIEKFRDSFGSHMIITPNQYSIVHLIPMAEYVES